MRASGIIDSARDLERDSHVCWEFSDRADFLARAAEFIADGLQSNQRIEYVGGRDVPALRAELEGMDLDRSAIRTDRIRIHPVAEFFRFQAESDVVDPRASIAQLPAALASARATGYSGLRIITDASTMARSPHQRAALADLEYLLDRASAQGPLSAMCAYDVAVLGAAEAAEIACLHPTTNRGASAFRLYAESDSDFALAGELDLASRDLFEASIDRMARHVEAGSRVALDVRGVTFMGHHTLLALDAVAATHGMSLEIRAASEVVRRIGALLELKNLQFAGEVAA